MPIGSTLPPQNLHPSLVGQVRFRCSASPLNPLNLPGDRNPADGTPTQITKQHLANLEKLLQKQKRSPEPDPDLPTRPRGANGILERLNLTHLWPEMKSAEEMSPRHLSRLQRLLSDSAAEYSPRNSLAFRWREYHGSNNWSGMLDPLDENLRREVVRYGEFVQAAYHCFHSCPATTSGEAHRPPHHVTLPDRSYRVTKSLYTTASVGLPRWVDDVAPDLGWMTQRSSRVGFVAVCDDPREIQRMGRRDIVIALRGTATCLEWAENFRTGLISSGDNHAKVQRGFLSLFETRSHDMPSLAESVGDEINRLIEKYRGEALSVTVTGHSLGGALALLVADGLPSGGPPVAAISFGGPRVGNRGFAARLESKGVNVLRVVNERDVVTRFPGVPVGESLIEGRSWAYTHVGSELRVETRMSPFLRADADVGCCHDLEAYLHLVDGFSGSDRPFRGDAKRSLWRLVNQQRSNMKRLYTSKGMGSGLSSSDVCRDVSFV